MAALLPDMAALLPIDDSGVRMSIPEVRKAKSNIAHLRRRANDAQGLAATIMLALGEDETRAADADPAQAAGRQEARNAASELMVQAQRLHRALAYLDRWVDGQLRASEAADVAAAIRKRSWSAC